MFYARCMDKHGVDVIDSKTLKMKRYSFDELYRLVISGVEVSRLDTIFDGPYEETIYTWDAEDVSKYAGFEYMGDDSFEVSNSYKYDNLTLKYSDKIPLRLGSTIMDFSVNLPDIIIKMDDITCNVWYNGWLIKMSIVGLQGIFRRGDLVYAHYSVIVHGEEESAVVLITSMHMKEQCSRSEFLRRMLLE